MELGIRLTCKDLGESKLSRFTREVAQGLRSTLVGDVHLSAEEPHAGTKGDPIAIGSIILTLIGSGGVAVSLIQVLRSFVERKSSLHFELTRPDGKKMEMMAENLDHKNLERTAQAVETFLKG